MADPQVGDKLINDAGTVVELANVIEGEVAQLGTFPASRVGELLAAGYRPVEPDEIIPLQFNQVATAPPDVPPEALEAPPE